ncbi:MAG: nitroreductase family protein [Kiritimatiellae bacterium]|nr:nitroreductase family protein [Kiritimatiellia bacterium]
MLKDLVLKNRSCRRFREDDPIARETLLELVDLARLSPSGANLQPLRYVLAHDPETNALVFPNLQWAGYLKDWKGPEKGERPAAYIVILHDTKVTSHLGVDHGFAAQTILLGAVEKGLAGCVIGSIDRERLRLNLKIPDYFEILLVLALGNPGEKVVIEPVGSEHGVKYWRDREGVHHVPKRARDDLIVSF